MTLINRESKLSEIIIHDHSTITVLDRFGIGLGVGDAKVNEICEEKGIDVDFFTTILNTFMNENYFPQRAMESFSVANLIDYLNKTNTYYEKNVLPNIERHFSFLIAKSTSANNNLVIMRQFFDEVKGELLQRIANDRNQWFPDVVNKNQPHPDRIGNLEDYKEVNDPIEDKIDDLINMLVIHLKGDYDHNLGYAVIVAIFSLKKDIKQNNRIRNRILRPISQALSTSND